MRNCFLRENTLLTLFGFPFFEFERRLCRPEKSLQMSQMSQPSQVSQVSQTSQMSHLSHLFQVSQPLFPIIPTNSFINDKFVLIHRYI